jgi:hypothetical protein
MNLKAWTVGLALALAAVAPATAQRGGGNWELLGEERVGIGNDRDVITLGHNETTIAGNRIGSSASSPRVEKFECGLSASSI